jgi:GNAT superfamily N-acetyltransferase
MKVAKDIVSFNKKHNKFLAGENPYKRKWHNFYAMEGRKILGGAMCYTKWGWLYVDILKVSETARNSGLGTKLMQTVEEFARANGFEGVYLNTFEFQARPFYEKLGFILSGTIEGLPPESKMYTLSKKFK